MLSRFSFRPSCLLTVTSLIWVTCAAAADRTPDLDPSPELQSRLDSVAANLGHGTAGFWRGNYFTALEGSLRTSFLIRWPGKIKAGSVNNEMVHITDMLPTFSSVAGYDVPDDRQIDGIDQIDFFLGKQKESNREGFPVYWGDTLECTAAAGWVSTKGETSDTD